ncbi:hypothetical protein V1525DRAFT_108112 [Lipomyces kononenkoae]|uniref:Uncharacterized protein n=1 Tax=Lipomyces kononenkoae TaxID=34357 RepID=A0ACC3SQH4_LIPKO
MNIENFTYHSFQDGRLVTRSAPPARSRQRKQFSCIECHRQKIKCDRGRPCHKCIASGQRELCRYKSSLLTTTGQLLPREVRNQTPLHSELYQRVIPSTATINDAHQPMFRSDTHADVSWGSTPPYESVVSAKQADRGPQFALYRQGKARFKGPTHWSLLAKEFKELTPFGSAQVIFQASPACLLSS